MHIEKRIYLDIKIIVAAHKPYPMPEDTMYLPLHVGAEGKESIGFVGDNTGDNMSNKNGSYCELTGLYWAWRNLDCQYLGMAHYRRHFAGSPSRSHNTTSQPTDKLRNVPDTVYENLGKVLTREEAQQLLTQADILVPKKRNYYIETLYSHYAHTHDASHLDMTAHIIKKLCPSYSDSFQQVIHSRGGYMFNMFVMSKTDVDEYCSWLFPILTELEKQVDTSNLSAFQGRLYGRVSEILFNVWLREKRKTGSRIKEVPCIHMEPVNWWVKGTAFLKAKFTGKKYEGSF